MRAGGARRGTRLTDASPGRLFVGTSGFAYPDWSPRFYPPGLRGDALLPWYATRFPSCELNNTFYQRPTEAKVRSWVAATPEGFRFAVKAQRGGSLRAFLRDPDGSIPWLNEPLAWFGDRLGSVLFRVPGDVRFDLGRLESFLAAWPSTVPLTMEFEAADWAVDETFARLQAARVALCATERPEDPDPPALHLTGRFLYLRLRRHDYEPDAIEAWAARIVPFLDAGTDAFVFFRHDEVGRATELAAALDEAVGRTRGAGRSVVR